MATTNFVYSECLNGIEYVFNSDLLSFDAATLACESLNGQLAVPTTSAEYTRITDVFLNNRPVGMDNHKHAKIGLRDVNDVGGLSTTRFETIDGEVPGFTAGERGQYPWHENQPDDLYGVQNCLAVSGFTGLLIDMQCVQPMPSVCERICTTFPTTSPTETPTENPTASPTSLLFFDQCQDGIQYIFNPELLTHDDAVAVCEGAAAELAVPTSNTQLARMSDFFFASRPGSMSPHKHAFLGLRDYLDIGGLSTSRFETVDGIVPSFTSGQRGVYPWHENQPDDLYDKHNCIAISGFSKLLVDMQCPQPMPSLCQRTCS